MTKYREMLRLASLGLSQQSIADSCYASKKTVNQVLKRAKELQLQWPLADPDTDAAIAKKLFPSAPGTISSGTKLHHFDYTQKELLRNGVNKKLLWTEYLEECRLYGESPLMYSQFCYHIQQDEQNWEYMRGLSPDRRHSSRYSVQRSFLLTPLRSNSFWM